MTSTRRISLAVLITTLLALAPANALASPRWLVGSMHEHSAYSDGYLGSRPFDFYLSGRNHGLDFMGGSDHSDTLGLPNSVNDACVDDPLQTPCLMADTTNPADSWRKWEATGEQAAAASTPTFTAFRGLEWTTDRFGHINVYFSKAWTNAKTDGGYASMDLFYSWLTGAASDGVATFNHPGDKKLSTSDPGYNWNDFAYVPAADRQMVGIETYNSASDFGSPGAHGGPPEGWYAHALDRGWHLGPVGAEDLGHHVGDDWGGPAQAKTVILSDGRSPAAIEDALLARRFYAVAGPQWRLGFTIDGAQMGSRLTRRANQSLRIAGSVSRVDRRPLGGPVRLDLVTSEGRLVASGAKPSLDVRHGAYRDERWYFLRATVGDQVVGYSAPVWVAGS